jgi:hypothetical protein
MMRVSVRFPGDIVAHFKKILPSQSDMLLLGGDAMTKIKQHTQRGEDVNGGGFAPYSENYADYREKKGRRRSPVNLTFHGDMLKSMAVRNIANGVQIYFMDAERGAVARYHNEGTPTMPQREFFGLSQSELQQITDQLIQRIRARL